MRLSPSLLLAGVASGVLGQIFEPADFNATDALIALGVNVAALPALDALVDRSSTAGCSIAVSHTIVIGLMFSNGCDSAVA